MPIKSVSVFGIKIDPIGRVVERVFIRPVNGRHIATEAELIQATSNTIIIEIKTPPPWLRKMERRRGIFSGCHVRMCLYRNFKKHWSWDQDITKDFHVML